jgi:hypothetical protein
MSASLLTISGLGESTGVAASAGRGEGAGTAARAVCLGESTAAAKRARKAFVALSFQQCSLPCVDALWEISLLPRFPSCRLASHKPVTTLS